LIARRWVTEETLYSLAPWLSQVSVPPPDPATVPSKSAAPDKQAKTAKSQPAADPAPSNETHKSSENFEDNLRTYRELMEEILGDAN
jgi:hypothetical protein